MTFTISGSARTRKVQKQPEAWLHLCAQLTVPGYHTEAMMVPRYDYRRLTTYSCPDCATRRPKRP